MVPREFFERDAQELARALLGKVIRHRVGRLWLAAMIVETEAYYEREKGSHASLGRTPSREALFMPAGTLYMYYARGGDSLNISAAGAGNAVLVKSGIPWFDHLSPIGPALRAMQRMNPSPRGKRTLERLCAGQTLLCRALGLKVKDWDRKELDPARLTIEDVGYRPERVVQARRLGIPPGRDEHLMYRFIDQLRVSSSTSNPLTRRTYREGIDYVILTAG
jgi:DNA-3-methyladenine glycosylase